MGKLTDQELLFLGNIIYTEPEVIYADHGVKVINPFGNLWDNRKYRFMTIGNIIKKINTDALRNNIYLKDHLFNGEITGSEWADMIDAMKRSDICELMLRDVNYDVKNSLSAYFTDKEGNAYVVFKGTSIGEWEDIFAGACVTDTEQQKYALDYINSISAKNITVVGHSKGGNIAKYVALLSDKVTRCVSFDGQGFSRLFIDKYQDLIEVNKYKIICYSLDEDFANILLYDIYFAKYYVKGQGVSSFTQKHSPNSFFNFFYNEEGKAIFYNFEISDQAGYMAELHSFVNYVSATIPEEDRKDFYAFLGKIVSMKMGKMPPDYTKSYSDKQMITYLMSEENADEMGLLLAYLVKYEEYDKGITDAVFGFITGLGYGSLVKWLKFVKEYVNAENILKYAMEHHDIAVLILKGNLAPDFIADFIDKAAAAYKEKKDTISPVTAGNIAEYDASANDTIRDYSEPIRDMLLNLTDEVANEKPYDVSKWDVWYRMEDWFRNLNISNYLNNIDENYRKVLDINGTSNQQLQQIFYNIDTTVANYKSRMNEETQRLKTLNNKFLELINTDINSAC